MSHRTTIVAVLVISFPALANPQGGDADRARADALKALKGGDRPFSQDLERSKQKWPAFDREVEAGIVEQQKALDEGSKATEDLVLMLQNRAKMQATPPALYLYGRFLGLIDRVDEASSQFEGALRLDPYFPWAHHGLGTCAAKRGRFVEAVRAYERAVELNPGFVRSMEPLAACLLQTERYDEAERVLRGLVKLQPEDAQAWIALGKLLSARTRYPEAADAFRKALEKRPSHPEARRMLALSLIQAQQAKDAIVVYEGMLKENPGDPHALMGMGRAHEYIGENHVAADFYQKVLDNWSTSTPGSKSDLVAHIDELRRLPPVERRDPRMKSPHEWCEILLNSTEPERCREAIRILSTFPGFDEEIYKAFLKALKNKDATVRVLAMRELGKRYEGILSELTDLLVLFLDDADPLVRGMSARILGDGEDPKAVPSLVKALKVRDPYVFREVYDALWKLTASEMPVKLAKDLTPEAMEAAAKGWQDWYAQNRDRYKKYETANK